jgi:NAD(P)-dependent dehydrogenase (short-subunit alcohol dehydrogenase family)
MILGPSPICDATGKVALITGGSRGIGEGCARVFVRAGAHVVICSRSPEVGRPLAAELSAQGPGSCAFIRCDVTSPEEIESLVAETVALHGRLDCLLNNAGRHPDHRPIDGFSVAEFEDLLQVNLVPYFAAAKLALPHLRAGQGSIINMSSLVGSMGQEWACTYAATKGAISALTRGLAIDEARHGVRVNSVSPGNIASPAVVALPPEVGEVVARWQWQGRVGLLEEVGKACLYLASDAARFITGIDLVISGGAELGYGVKQPDPALARGLETRG